MRDCSAVLVGVSFLLLIGAPSAAMAQKRDCGVSSLSDEQVRSIVEKERKQQKELPPAIPDAKWTVQRQECHYLYTEMGATERPENTHMFWLNRHGVIVDVRPGALRCPDKVLTEAELAQSVAAERARRKDLPPPFAKITVTVTRQRCLYIYSEFLASDLTKYQAFTIDPFGDVMDVFRSK